jgi:hypothetical protein
MGSLTSIRLLKEHSYALVAAEQLEYLPSGIDSVRIATGVLADSTELMPALISLRDLSPDQGKALLDMTLEQHESGDVVSMCTVFQTDSSPSEIRSHLGHIQLCKSHKGERGWLRVHDPRVWGQLQRAFEPDTLAWLYGPITRWTVCLDGEWIDTAPPAVTGSKPAPYFRRATQQEWLTLGRIGIVNRALARLDLPGYANMIRHSPQLDALTSRAQTRHGLSKTSELLDYVCLGWQVHPRFDEHPIAIQAIEDYRKSLDGADTDDDTSVVYALMEIQADQWDRVRRDLSSGT